MYIALVDRITYFIFIFFIFFAPMRSDLRFPFVLAAVRRHGLLQDASLRPWIRRFNGGPRAGGCADDPQPYRTSLGKQPVTQPPNHTNFRLYRFIEKKNQ